MLCTLLLWMFQQHLLQHCFHSLRSVCNQLDCRRYELIFRAHSHQVQRSQQTFHNYLVPIFWLNIQHHLQSQFQVIRFKDHFSKYQLHIEQALSTCHFAMLQCDHKVHYHTHDLHLHHQHNHHLQLLDNHDQQVHVTKITVSSPKCEWNWKKPVLDWTLLSMMWQLWFQRDIEEFPKVQYHDLKLGAWDQAI